jgi:hypothetical protein
MFHVLIDTSVWLKLAEDHKLTPLLQVVRGFVSLKKMRLIVPQLVVEEFQRNRERVAKTVSRSFTFQVNEVRKAITKVGGDQKTTKLVLKHLDEVNHKLPKLGMPAGDTFGTIEELFKEADVIEASESVMARAAGRQLNRKAPCHQNKISIADAVIFETFLDAFKIGFRGDRFAFVTDNVHDFSSATDQRLPHPDIAATFSKIRTMYFNNLAMCLRKIDPSFVSEVEWLALQEQPRSIAELLKAHTLFDDQVRYNRYQNMLWEIEKGKLKMVTKAHWDELIAKDRRNHGKYIIDSILPVAAKNIAKVEKRLGQDNLGPWSHFEWGMINGKLSAIRWMLGDEWDNLDT